MNIDTSGPQGNAWAIMGIVSDLLKRTDRKDEVKEVMDRMMSGDYENLCEVATEVSNGVITFDDEDDGDWYEGGWYEGADDKITWKVR